MNQPPLDRAAFLRTLRRCHTEEQLFSRLTFACLAQYDEAQRPELLDDVRGAAYSLRLPAVEYKTDQWLHRCQDAIDTDRDAFLAAANAEARRENDKMRAEQTPVGPGVLADVPLQNVDWLVPDLLPRGELSLLGADGGTGKGLWQAQLIACVTTGKTSGFFPVPPAQTGKVLILAGEDDPGKVLKARLLAAGADMNRVLCLTADDYFQRTGQPLTLKDEALAKFAAKAGPLLLIVDPLQSFLPAGVEMASRNQMRSILLPLKAIAAAQQCAVLLVMHSNKKQGVSDRKRLADSSDIWDMARSVLMMGRSNSDGKIYLSHEKSSYSRPSRPCCCTSRTWSWTASGRRRPCLTATPTRKTPTSSRSRGCGRPRPRRTRGTPSSTCWPRAGWAAWQAVSCAPPSCRKSDAATAHTTVPIASL